MGATINLTCVSPKRPPSSARPRSTYVPGRSKVTPTSQRMSSGTGGALHNGDQGELPPVRESSQTFTWKGSNITSPSPRYTNQARCSPLTFATVIRDGGRSCRALSVGGASLVSGCSVLVLTRGSPSSSTVATSVTRCPTVALRSVSPSS